MTRTLAATSCIECQGRKEVDGGVRHWQPRSDLNHDGIFLDYLHWVRRMGLLMGVAPHLLPSQMNRVCRRSHCENVCVRVCARAHEQPEWRHIVCGCSCWLFCPSSLPRVLCCLHLASYAAALPTFVTPTLLSSKDERRSLFPCAPS